MNKRMMLVVLLVNMVTAVSGTDFEERITEKKYQPYLTEEENISFYDGAYDDMIYWFTESAFYRDCVDWYKVNDSGMRLVCNNC